MLPSASRRRQGADRLRIYPGAGRRTDGSAAFTPLHRTIGQEGHAISDRLLFCTVKRRKRRAPAYWDRLLMPRAGHPRPGALGLGEQLSMLIDFPFDPRREKTYKGVSASPDNHHPAIALLCLNDCVAP